MRALLILASLTLLLPGAASANDKSRICASYLSAGRGLDLAGNTRAEAERYLALFRAHVLQQPDVDGKTDSIQADSSDAGTRDLRRVAERIRGIEQHVWKDSTGRMQEGEAEELNRQRFVKGYVLRGRNAILHYTDLVSEGMRELQGSDSIVDVFLRNGRFLRVAIGLQLAQNAVRDALFSAASLDGSLAVTAATNLIAAVVLGADIPVWILRSQDFIFQSRLNQIREWAEVPPPSGTWMYDAIDARLTDEMMKDLEVQARTPVIVDRQRDFDLASLMGRLFLSEQRQKSSWILSDRLFTVDENGEPVLVLFVRAGRKVPAYPQRVRQSAWDRLKQGFIAPAPAREPAHGPRR